MTHLARALDLGCQEILPVSTHELGARGVPWERKFRSHLKIIIKKQIKTHFKINLGFRCTPPAYSRLFGGSSRPACMQSGRFRYRPPLPGTFAGSSMGGPAMKGVSADKMHHSSHTTVCTDKEGCEYPQTKKDMGLRPGVRSGVRSPFRSLLPLLRAEW